MCKWFSILFFVIVPALLFGQEKKGDIEKDQQIKGVIIAGMNMSQVDGDEVYGYYKFGANVGVGAIIPLKKNFSIGIETLFNQKGSYKKFPPAGDSTGIPYYKLRLDYLDVPLMVYYEDRHVWTFGLGFSWGRRVNYKETIRGYDTTFSQYMLNGTPLYGSHIVEGDTTLTQYPLLKNDWNVIVSIYLRIWKHLKLNVRYSYSMANIGRRDYINASGATWTRKLFNNVISVRLMYLLNEKYVPPPKEKKNKNKKTTASLPDWNL